MAGPAGLDLAGCGALRIVLTNGTPLRLKPWLYAHIACAFLARFSGNLLAHFKKGGWRRHPPARLWICALTLLMQASLRNVVAREVA